MTRPVPISAGPMTQPGQSALPDPNPRTLTIAGWALTGAYALFMAGASIAPKLLGLPVAEDTLAALGWPPGHALTLGLIELACLLLFLWPRTALLGAVLTMAYLGGAIATQIRAESPLFSHILFGLYLGLVLWGGLWLRTPWLRRVFPITQRSAQ